MINNSTAYLNETLQNVLLEFEKSPDSLIKLLRKVEPFAKSKNCVNSDEYKLNIAGTDVFIKSYINRTWLMRILFGIFWTRSEFLANKAIIERTSAHVAVPFCIIQKYNLLLQYIPNKGHLDSPKPRKAFTIPDRSFFTELINDVRCLHKNGISHGDIRKTNILIGEDGHPWLVDTVSAIVLGDNPSFLKKYVFSCMAASDMFSLAKIVFLYYPDWEDKELRKAYENPPILLKLGRFLRHYIYRTFRRKKRK